MNTESQSIDTGGGASVGSNVNTDGGDFVGRDSKRVQGDKNTVFYIDAHQVIVGSGISNPESSYENNDGGAQPLKSYQEFNASAERNPLESLVQQFPIKLDLGMHIVDPLHGGNYRTISEAIASAKPGERILVRPGLYREKLVIDKWIEIIGDGERGKIMIQAAGEEVVLFKAIAGRIANLTLQQMGGSEHSTVDIAIGCLELEDCDISGRGSACVSIHDGADPYLRRNYIHAGKEKGINIYTLGNGTLEDNDIFNNGYAGVEIGNGAGPTLRRNRIYNNRGGGVFCFGGRWGAVIEDNDIFSNTLAGVAVQTNAHPIVRGNRINKNGTVAVWVHFGGIGTFEDNDLRNNAQGAWDIDSYNESEIVRVRNLE